MNESVEYAWAAGFLDGDGCFAFVKSSRSNADPSFRNCIIAVSQKNRRPLDKLASLFGGLVREQRMSVDGTQIWQWVVGGKKVIPIIEAVLPYLVSKQGEARILLRYAKTYGTTGLRKTEMQKRYRSHLIRRHSHFRKEVSSL